MNSLPMDQHSAASLNGFVFAAVPLWADDSRLQSAGNLLLTLCLFGIALVGVAADVVAGERF